MNLSIDIHVLVIALFTVLSALGFGYTCRDTPGRYRALWHEIAVGFLATVLCIYNILYVIWWLK